MESKVYTYEGDEVTVTWDMKRCIHAKACVNGLPSVFDPDDRPWIEPDEADPEAVEEVVMQCPTGALHVERNGENPEPTPDANRIRLFPNGPLLVKGDVRLLGADGEVLLEDTRMALCRCGRSGNKPLCDGSHDPSDGEGFSDPGHVGDNCLSSREGPGRDGPLTIRVLEGGPLKVEGPVTIEGADDETCSGTTGALCRCGASGSKPFCDGSHASVDM